MALPPHVNADPMPDLDRWGVGSDGICQVQPHTLPHKVYCYTVLCMAAKTPPEASPRNIGRELKKGSLELVVLSRLARGEAYGYEIVSELTERTGGVFEITDGTLYPVLYRLERGGFVAIRWETPERGVPRKYYQLTAAGRDELRALTDEWTRYVRAVQKLLKTEGDKP